MSSYLDIPGSKVKLKDGSIIMLRRFPGTKWVVHNGWYNYNGKNYTGWYFSSVPAQTILPVNRYDLQGIVVVSDKDTSPSDDPVFPPYPPVVPEYPIHPGPHPGPWPGPWPDDKFGPNPFPPFPPMPPIDKPEHFGRKELTMLNSAFITVENLRDFDELDTEVMPDGRMVCINSEKGKRTYYRWNKRDDTWDAIDPVAIIDDEISYALASYSTSEEVEAKIAEVSETLHTEISEVDNKATQNASDISALDTRIDEVESAAADALEALSAKEEADVSELTQNLESLQTELGELRAIFADYADDVAQELDGVKSRLDEIEDAIFNVKKLADILGTNTILVSNEGGIADSGFSLGDDFIDELPEYANVKTVATEKAVAELVARSTPQWTSF